MLERLMRPSVFAIALVGVWILIPHASSRTDAEPHTIKPWHKIGTVGLGMLRSAVDYRHGPSADRYSRTIRVEGGELFAGYAGNRVSFIFTTSRVFRTATDVGVGSAIPLGPCRRTRMNPCERRWNGFVYRSLTSDWFLETCFAGIPTYAGLGVRRGIVTDVRLGFGSNATCTSIRLPPLTRRQRKKIIETITRAVASPGRRVTVRGLITPDSTRTYAAATVLSKGLDPLSVIVRNRGGAWTVVAWGTSGVGCGDVPIKYLAEMAFTCPG